MAGRNLWHKPYFQPELNSVTKFASSKDRYLWETKYNHHLQRLQDIQSRPTHRPKIIKREYGPAEVQQIEADKARQFFERTQLNTLPLDSRPPSPSSSRRASLRNSEVSGLNRSPNISPRSSNIRRHTAPNSLQSLYPNQNYPIIKRASIPKQPKVKSGKDCNCDTTFIDSDHFFKSRVSGMWNGLPNCCKKKDLGKFDHLKIDEGDEVGEFLDNIGRV